MNNINFLKEIGKEMELLLNQLINNLPIGSLILDETQEIVYINNKLLSYFDGSLDLTYKHFIKLFNCNFVNMDSKVSLSYHNCKSCKFRKSLKKVFVENKTVANLEMKDIWTIDDKVFSKWFDVSLVPFEYKTKRYVWVTLTDITDLMKFKLEADCFHILNEEDNVIEKNRFHENVMECISKQCQKDGEAYLVLTELKDLELIQDTFGFLWKNEHLYSFYAYLLKLLGPKDYSCRYSNNQFLTFLPCSEGEDVEKFIGQLDSYNNQHFHVKEILFHKIVKIYIDKDTTKKLLFEDRLHVEYFKVLANIEKFNGQGVCEIFFE